MQKILQHRFSKTFLGSILIGGTAFGAAMLANPVATAGAGLFPSYMIYFLCWIFSVATGFLFVELASWFPKNANLMSMAEKFLGSFGKWAVIGVYIFQFYFILIAYVSVGGRIVIESVCNHIPYVFGVLAYCAVFGSFVVKGTKGSSRLNAFLMIGLILSFLSFIYLAVGKASFERANYSGWSYAFFGLPIIFTSFSYQASIPTLYNYLDQDANQTKKAIFFGTLIPFASYLVWGFLIKGIVSAGGENGLFHAKALGWTAIEPLAYAVKDPRVVQVGQFFGFFALTTSFIGVSLGMVDFFADVFKVKPIGINRVYLGLMILLPVICVVLTNPTIFLVALTLGGGFGAGLLLGVLPILLIWIGRKKKEFKGAPRSLFGGNAMLAVLAFAICVELVFCFAMLV